MDIADIACLTELMVSGMGFYSQCVTWADLKMEGGRSLDRDVLIIVVTYDARLQEIV